MRILGTLLVVVLWVMGSFAIAEGVLLVFDQPLADIIGLTLGFVFGALVLYPLLRGLWAR